MGAAEDWQSAVATRLQVRPGTLLNPRRPDWDASWRQHVDDPQFRGQVEWELSAQEAADLMYFAPDTRAPITLLELGLFAKKRLFVCCPDGYWRKGNVDVVCRRYGIRQVGSLSELGDAADAWLQARATDGG